MTVTTRTRPVAQLRQLAGDGAATLGAHPSADAVLDWLVTTVGTNVAVACSMADGVLPHLVSQHRPGVDVLFLDTGYHFAETHQTRDEVGADLDVTIIDVRPARTVAEQDDQEGPDLFARDPGRCCQLRKVDPLGGALTAYDAWITGVRRDESPTRAHTPFVTFDERHGLIKVNPLAAWSFEDLLAYAARHLVPLNPLLAQGYPSIGCQPCTRPVAPGADPRSGRWADLTKTECGIHT